MEVVAHDALGVDLDGEAARELADLADAVDEPTVCGASSYVCRDVRSSRSGAVDGRMSRLPCDIGPVPPLPSGSAACEMSYAL